MTELWHDWSKALGIKVSRLDQPLHLVANEFSECVVILNLPQYGTTGFCDFRYPKI